MVFLGVSILPLSTAFVIAFGNVPTMWYCFSFHFNDTVESGHILLSMKSLNIQRGNQNPYIEEEQTTQCPNEKVQKCTQQSTKPIHKTKDRVAESY